MSSVSATSSESGRRAGLVAVGAVLAIVGVLALIAGVIYISQTEANVPAFLPGHVTTGKDATLHHTLRGIGGIVVAVILFIAAALSFRSSRGKTPQS